MPESLALIRQLGHDDGSRWWMLRLESLLDEPRAFVGSVDDGLPPNSQAAVVICGRLPDRCIFGAFADDKLVGILKLERKGMIKTRHKATLSAGYVAMPYRRRGIAHRMVKSALRYAENLVELEEVQVAIDPANLAASSLCRSFGFESFGFEQRALRVGTDYSDLEHMRLRIRTVNGDDKLNSMSEQPHHENRHHRLSSEEQS
jgi:RimJ/RimL family protein N-acetyltransferase